MNSEEAPSQNPATSAYVVEKQRPSAVRQAGEFLVKLSLSLLGLGAFFGIVFGLNLPVWVALIALALFYIIVRQVRANRNTQSKPLSVQPAAVSEGANSPQKQPPDYTRFYIRAPQSNDFSGPATLQEIRFLLKGGKITVGHSVLEAAGQTSGALKKSTHWKAINEKWTVSELEPPVKQATQETSSQLTPSVSVGKKVSGWILVALGALMAASISSQLIMGMADPSYLVGLIICAIFIIGGLAMASPPKKS